MKHTIVLAVAATTLTNVTHAENLIKLAWSSFKNSQPNDISKTNSGISKVSHGPFYFYKLNNNKVENELKVESTNDVQLQDVIKQIESHPDNDPVEPVVSVNQQTNEEAVVVEKSEKDLLYGNESPLRDDAVAAAWERANLAQKKLDEHRVYMDKLRKTRIQKSQAKTLTASSNQNVGD